MSIDRQNHLSQLVRSKPELAMELVSSLGENVKEARRKKAQQAYDDLVVLLDAPPLVVLYRVRSIVDKFSGFAS
jgi:sulfite reductase (NADPH) hemoprotein beta-component